MLAPSTNAELIETLRQRLAGWEAKVRPAAESFSSGCDALNHMLPDQGFRRGIIAELLADAGSGATALALVAAREACREGGAVIIVDRQRQFYPPAAANLGVDLERAIFVRPRTLKDERWTLRQCLGCPGVGAVLCWPSRLEAKSYQGLALAAEASGAVGLFVRPLSARGSPTWAEVTLLIEPQSSGNDARRLRVEVLRCRSGRSGQSVELELNDETGVLQAAGALPLASPVAGATTPARAARS
jgi:hypothetical protein